MGQFLRNFDGLDEFIFKDILLERNSILLTTSLHSNSIFHLFTLDKLKQTMNVSESLSTFGMDRGDEYFE